MRLILLLLSAVCLVGCATSLTERGKAINVVDGLSAELTSDCKRLGSVSGRAKSGWGNEIGFEQALNDARNKAGLRAGADTMAISNANRKFAGGEVNAVVFDCSKKRVQYTREIEPAKKESARDDYEMGKKCQEKGGVWTGDQCVIKVE